MYRLACLFVLFIIYSIIGYIIEIIACAIESDELTFSRGFLIGPVIPVFGIGGMLMYFLLYRYINDIAALFIMSMVLCTVLEYITSYILEKAFKLRWWDYSDKRFNMNGRICLSNAIGFGFAGVIIMKIVNPILINFISSIPINLLYVIALILCVLFVIDLILSLNTVLKLKLNVSALEGKDATFWIKKEVKKDLKKHSILTKRLVKAFPDLSKLNKSFRHYKIENLITGKKRFRLFKKK